MSIRCISLYRFPTNLCCIFLIYRFNCIIKHGNKRDVSVTCINSLWYWEESLSYFWREKKKKYLINVLYFIREMKKVLARFASPWRGLNEKRAVVVLIFNGLLFPWEDGLWLFFLFGNIHSHHAHHPETWRNRLKRGRKTRDTTLPLQIPSKMGKRSFSVVFDRFSLHTCISSSQWQTQTLKGVIKVRKSSLLVARLGNYIHDKLEKMEGFFFICGTCSGSLLDCDCWASVFCYSLTTHRVTEEAVHVTEVDSLEGFMFHATPPRLTQLHYSDNSV